MRKIVPSLIWFSALAWGFGCGARTAAANGASTNAGAALPENHSRGFGDTVVYRNQKYGFTFSLPPSWSGFDVSECQWGGDRDGREIGAYGATVSIRHPLYSRANSGQEIPIMVFTKAQWRDVESGKLDVSAAPFPPNYLGQNRKYVFAIESRFDYDDLDGFENARAFFDSNPLRASRIRHEKHRVEREQVEASGCD
jgi:hypothetical protein